MQLGPHASTRWTADNAIGERAAGGPRAEWLRPGSAPERGCRGRAIRYPPAAAASPMRKIHGEAAVRTASTVTITPTAVSAAIPDGSCPSSHRVGGDGVTGAPAAIRRAVSGSRSKQLLMARPITTPPPHRALDDPHPQPGDGRLADCPPGPSTLATISSTRRRSAARSGGRTERGQTTASTTKPSSARAAGFTGVSLKNRSVPQRRERGVELVVAVPGHDRAQPRRSRLPPRTVVNSPPLDRERRQLGPRRGRRLVTEHRPRQPPRNLGRAGR